VGGASEHQPSEEPVAEKLGGDGATCEVEDVGNALRGCSRRGAGLELRYQTCGARRWKRGLTRIGGIHLIPPPLASAGRGVAGAHHIGNSKSNHLGAQGTF